MSTPGKATTDVTPSPEQMAALEREVAELRRQLAMVSGELPAATDPEELGDSYNEARYRALIELSPQVVWMTDAKSNNIYCNRHWYDFSGMTVEQTLGTGWASAIHPDDFARALVEWKDRVARGIAYEWEVRFRRKDGEYRWHLCRGVPLKDNAGRVVRWLGIALDIHDRKTAAAAIDEANQRMRMAMEAAEAGTWDYYPKTGKIECSPRCLAIFKTPPGVVPNADTFVQVLHREDRERVLGVVERAMDPDVAGEYDMDYRIVRSDGTVRWVLVKGRSFFSGEGAAREAVRLAGIVLDVTERKEAERDRLSLAAAWQNSPDFIGITDRRGRTLFLNRAGQKMVGLRDDAEARSKNALDFLYEKDQSIVTNEMVPMVRAGGVWEGEFRFRHFVTGEPILVETRVFGIRDDRGRLTSVANLSRDISERKKLDERLRLAQKMEAVGRLAGGIAHDFNNLLTVITGAAEVLQLRWRDDRGSGEVIQEIRDAAERASGLTQQLLAFGKRQMVQPRAMDLNEAIVRVQSMLKRLAGEDISVQLALGTRVGNVMMDPIQVDQILINLAANARDAMPEGGVITITTFHVDTAPSALRSAASNAGGYACLLFSDSGRGIDHQTLNHIFEPFFTTKEQGRGTGLGLSTVYGIMDQIGGDITVQSSPGQGTSFTLYFPCTTEEVAMGKHEVESRSSAGSGTVLLVEDEVSLRAVVASYLREGGYRVHEAADAQEALEIGQGNDVDLLLTDIVMPGSNGPALATSLAAMHLRMRVIFMSGYADHAALQDALRQPNTLFLQKPFRLSALAVKIREALAAAKEPA